MTKKKTEGPSSAVGVCPIALGRHKNRCGQLRQIHAIEWRSYDGGYWFLCWHILGESGEIIDSSGGSIVEWERWKRKTSAAAVEAVMVA